MNPTGDGPRKQTRSGRTPAPPAALTVAAWFAFAPAIWASTKTDVLLFKNGDHLTCEVKELRSGQLQVKTDALSTVSVDWDKVARLTTVRMHEVQVSSGDTYYGPLEASTRDGYLVVRTSDGPRELELWDVVHMRPLRASFWNRIDGSLDVEGSYTHASRLLQFTPSLDTTYAARAFTLDFDFDWTLTHQEEEEDTERLDATIRYGRSFARRFVAFGEVTAQRNSELGLDWRTELAGGVGRFLVATNRSLLTVGAGLAGNRELSTDGTSTANLEGLLLAKWRVFSYNYPKTDLSVSWVFYPSLSDPGRVRGEADLSLKREILHDFTVGIHAYDSFDTRPASEAASTNDWAATLSLGWTF